MSSNDPCNVKDYSALLPETLLEAIESVGFQTDSRTLELNSYENRVYQVGIEDDLPVIAKFYRPKRWTDEQILEEHQFCAELVAADLPVVAPTSIGDSTLFSYQGYRFSVYPRQGGRAPEFDNLDNLLTMGRFLGRIHAAARAKPFEYRPSINAQTFGHDSAEFVLHNYIPPSLAQSYEAICADLLRVIDEKLAAYKSYNEIRTHGDCHSGNVLWRDDAPHFVDFDDARSAPAVQDIWMLLCGSAQEQELQLCEVIEGYNEFSTFDTCELELIEVLRSLRIMHYAAWLARRWTDPAFPKAFPWFNSERYWGEHILQLREQFSAVQEPALRLL